jgi:hypothetical protein
MEACANDNEFDPFAVSAEWLDHDAPPNVWPGATVEHQETDPRISNLLCIPAPARFLSCEPMLGPLDLSRWTPRGLECPSCYWGGSEKDSECVTIQGNAHWRCPKCLADCSGLPPHEFLGAGIHWIICGFETGRNARPGHPDWARSLRDQSKAAGVPFFYKHHGEWLHESQRASADLIRRFDRCPVRGALSGTNGPTETRVGAWAGCSPATCLMASATWKSPRSKS